MAACAVGALSTVSAPAGRHEPGREVGERRQHEQPRRRRPGAGTTSRRGGLGRIGVGVDRARRRRPLDGDPVPAEDQQVEVELARPPATRGAGGRTSRSSVLERDEERERAGRRVRTGRDVEGDDGVAELGLVGDADRRGRVQPRHAAQARRRAAPRARRPPRRASPPHRRRSRRARRTRGRAVGHVVASLARVLDSGPHDTRSAVRHPAPGGRARRGRPAGALASPTPGRRWRERHATRLPAAGADDVAVVTGPPDGTPFGARLRDARRRAARRAASSSSARARSRSRPPPTGARSWPPPRADERRALANNRYSADVVAVAGAATLADLPDLPADNALPRWLAEVAGYRSTTCAAAGGSASTSTARSTSCCSASGRRGSAPVDVATASTARDSAASGPSPPTAAPSWWSPAGRPRRRSPGSSGATASRTRALVEERGLRDVAARAARRGRPTPSGPRRAPRARRARVARATARPARRRGDRRHAGPARPPARGGRGGAGRPPRTASRRTCCSPSAIADPWLRALTASAAAAPIPVLLGGHTLVGPGPPARRSGRPPRVRPWT